MNIKSLGIGDLRERVSLKSLSNVRADDGSYSETLITKATIWAAIEMQEIDGSTLAGSEAGVMKYLVYIRYSTLPEVGDVITWGDLTLKVKTPPVHTMDKEWSLLKCEAEQ